MFEGRVLGGTRSSPFYLDDVDGSLGFFDNIFGNIRISTLAAKR